MTDDEFEGVLNSFSECFLANDFCLWRSLVRLPLTIATHAGHIILRDEEELKLNFSHCRMSAEIQGLDEIVRRPVALNGAGDSTVLGTYETTLRSRGHKIVEPFSSTALIRRVDGCFKICLISNALGHHKWTLILPAVEEAMNLKKASSPANNFELDLPRLA